MRVDPDLSIYHEAESARAEFSREELKRLRMLLRRLRFLEKNIREKGGLADPSNNGGAMFAELEVEALEWILLEMDFIDEPTERGN